MNPAFPFSLSELEDQFEGTCYANSMVEREARAFWLNRQGDQKTLSVLAPKGDALLEEFEGQGEDFGNDYVLKSCPTDAGNAKALRAALPWLTARPLGLTTSAGFGDRLGLATPGHARALQGVLRDNASARIEPIYCQQSIREMTRTRRTPEEVMTDATWGAFQAGWAGALGADADHLKNTEDIDNCAAVGFTLFTIDPGDHVDSEADGDPAPTIEKKMEALPWNHLESSPEDLRRLYVGKTFDLGSQTLTLDEPSVRRAAAKYGRAVAHVVRMARHLEACGYTHELEVSVDETESPTTWAEHAYFASELKRLGVRWVSLAPRYVGRFEKGVDYIGDLDELRTQLDGHAAIARTLGPYKLSIHSGSDKFSVYPLIHAAAQGLVHLKTAGTSYLEALRVIGRIEPELFRQIGRLARERYETDKKTYHVSADLNQVPVIDQMGPEALPELLDDFHARQVFHVTFGSALDEFGDRIKAALNADEEAHYAALEQHFRRHLEPFVD